MKNLNETLLLTTIEAVVLVGGLSIQSIQPLILSMNGFHTITVNLPPQSLDNSQRKEDCGKKDQLKKPSVSDKHIH